MTRVYSDNQIHCFMVRMAELQREDKVTVTGSIGISIGIDPELVYYKTCSP